MKGEEETNVKLTGILEEGYGIVPKLFLKDARFDAYDKLIMVTLLSYSGAGKNFCFPSPDQITKYLGISRDRYFRSLKNLEENGAIKRESLTKKKYDNRKKYIIKIFTESFSKTVQYAKNIVQYPQKTSIPIIEQEEYYKKNKKIKKDSKKKESFLTPPKEKKDTSIKKLNTIIPQNVLDGIAEVISIGNFPKHKLSLTSEGKPTKTVQNIYKCMISIKSNRYFRDYTLNPDFIAKNKIDKSKLKGLTTWEELFTALRKAAKRFYKIKTDPEYWPVDKTKLKSMGLGTFLYNSHPLKKNSWFLHCISRRPEKLKKVMDIKATEPLRKQFTEKEQDAARLIMREGWNIYKFWEQTNEMREWYDQNIEMLRRVHSTGLVAGNVNGQINSLTSFFKKYAEFANGWNSFYLGNYGVNNSTWSEFSKWIEKEYGILLCPSAGKIKAAERVLSRN